MSDSLLLWDSGLILAALTALCKSGRVAPLGRLSPTRPMLGELTIPVWKRSSRKKQSSQRFMAWWGNRRELYTISLYLPNNTVWKFPPPYPAMFTAIDRIHSLSSYIIVYSTSMSKFTPLLMGIPFVSRFLPGNKQCCNSSIFFESLDGLNNVRNVFSSKLRYNSAAKAFWLGPFKNKKIYFWTALNTNDMFNSSTSSRVNVGSL